VGSRFPVVLFLICNLSFWRAVIELQPQPSRREATTVVVIMERPEPVAFGAGQPQQHVQFHLAPHQSAQYPPGSGVVCVAMQSLPAAAGYSLPHAPQAYSPSQVHPVYVHGVYAPVGESPPPYSADDQQADVLFHHPPCADNRRSRTTTIATDLFG
jgi:hypothetical protein